MTISRFIISSLLLLALVIGLPTAKAVDPFAIFDQVDSSYVMVAAHRGGYLSNGQWTHPENSLSAAQNSVFLGADILEVDVRLTSDGVPVLMHDSTVNRTTNGSGSISSMTFAQVQNLRLWGPGGLTNETVPTLEALMTQVEGTVLVNLDKLNITNGFAMGNVMQVLQDTDTVDHAIFKGGASKSQVDAVNAYYGETIHYMPILSNRSETTMINTLQTQEPPAVELIFNSSSTGMLSEDSVNTAAATDTHIWINSLWASLSAGHHDAVALGGNPDGSWGWLVDHGATIIQTDNTPQLISYLESQGLRNESVFPLGDLDFDGDVDENDWPLYRDGFGQDMSGLSIAEAYLLGDLDGDFDNDPIDFGLFKTAFDNDQGAGAFAAMLVSVPEPTSIALLAFGGLLLLPANRWRRTTPL